jgi:aminoglycoside 3-N-acetyltransferase
MVKYRKKKLTKSFLKRQIKGHLKKEYLRYLRWQYAFGPEEFFRFLRNSGVQTGDTIFVHCTMNGFEEFTGQPIDIISILLDSVGKFGTILMPTIPFSGSAIDWVKQNKVFDLKRTPSAMGLVTELFRRTPGVIRSIHPTHSVAAFGYRAEEMCANHHESSTPCGLYSPYERLLRHSGSILLIGVDIRAMTFFHATEELLEPLYPASPFTSQYYSLVSKDKDGALIKTKTRLFDPQLSQNRDTRRMIPILKAKKLWRSERLMNLEGFYFKAPAILDTLKLMAEQGKFCYDFQKCSSMDLN